MMTIEIRTDRYQNSYGHSPRGTGCWAFVGQEGQVILSPLMTLTAAKQWARREIQAKGLASHTYSTWWVAP